jgi:hypothetical protein
MSDIHLIRWWRCVVSSVLMAKVAVGSDRRSPVCARSFVATVCILVLLVVVGVSSTDLTNISQAKAPKRPDASHKPLAPAAATGAFGLDLMRAQGPGNLVISPAAWLRHWL